MGERDLTERQRQCLLLSGSMTNKEIARHLNLSPHTVSLHIRNGTAKLEVNTRREARRLIAQSELCTPDAMAPSTFPEPDQQALSPNVIESHKDDEPKSRRLQMSILPAYLPSPPQSTAVRLGLVASMAFIILMIVVSAVGVMGFVVEMVSKWAGA